MFTAHNAEFVYCTKGKGTYEVTSHIRMALTRTSESIPVAAGQLWLGTWQGLFLYEHRALGAERSVVVSVMGTTK